MKVTRSHSRKVDKALKKVAWASVPALSAKMARYLVVDGI
jgi:hypothetical protein